jgi:hypothetical protein
MRATTETMDTATLFIFIHGQSTSVQLTHRQVVLSFLSFEIASPHGFLPLARSYGLLRMILATKIMYSTRGRVECHIPIAPIQITDMAVPMRRLDLPSFHFHRMRATTILVDNIRTGLYKGGEPTSWPGTYC